MTSPDVKSAAERPDLRDVGSREFRTRLEQYFLPAQYTSLVRRYLRYAAVEVVEEAIQDVMLRVLRRFEQGARIENLDAYLHTSIKYALFDRLGGPATPEQPDDGGDLEPPLDLGQPAPEDPLAWKQLLHYIFDELPAKFADAAAQLMMGATPVELGETFGQNGYSLHTYLRAKICTIMSELVEKGDPLASSVHSKLCRKKARRS